MRVLRQISSGNYTKMSDEDLVVKEITKDIVEHLKEYSYVLSSGIVPMSTLSEISRIVPDVVSKWNQQYSVYERVLKWFEEEYGIRI